jgi:hypothetical protein
MALAPSPILASFTPSILNFMSMGLAQDVREHLLELEDWTSRHDTAAHSGSPQWDKKEGDPAL